MVWGSVIGAAGSIAGGLLGNASRSEPEDHFWDNAALQREFAQNGVRWKVADAKAAGLHPLAALGAQTNSYTPGYVGDTGSQQDYSWMANAGQHIGRAIEAKATEQERAKNRVYQDTANELQLENMRLQNDAIKMDMVRQLARDSERAITTQQRVPSMPLSQTGRDGRIIAGQGDSTTSGLFTVKPAEITANLPERPGTEAGSITELGFTRTNDGGYSPVMSKDAKERFEDEIIGELGWSVRNRLPAVFDSTTVAPPASYLPDGGKETRWRFDTRRGAWYAVPRDSSYLYHTLTDLGL